MSEIPELFEIPERGISGVRLKIEGKSEVNHPPRTCQIPTVTDSTVNSAKMRSKCGKGHLGQLSPGFPEVAEALERARHDPDQWVAREAVRSLHRHRLGDCQNSE
jgi:hypothetical protein